MCWHQTADHSVRTYRQPYASNVRAQKLYQYGEAPSGSLCVDTLIPETQQGLERSYGPAMEPITLDF